MAQTAAVLDIMVRANTARGIAGLQKTNKELQKVDRQTKKTEGRVTAMSRAGNRSFSLLATGAKAGGLALTAGLVVGLKKANDEAREAAKVGRLTDAALKSTKGAANVTKKEIEGLAEAISVKAGVDDEAVQSSQNLLLTFTKIRNETGRGNKIFTQASHTVADFAARFDKDLNQSAILVGKALNDPIKGVTSLTRVGVQFTQQQKDQIKTMVESGNIIGAQKVILGELGTQTRGAAAASADGMARFKVAIDNVFESLGGPLTAALSAAGNAAARFITQMQTGTGTGGRFAATVSSAFNTAKSAVGTAVASISAFLARNRTEINQTAQAFRNIGTAAVSVFQNVVLPVVRRVFPGIRQIIQGQLKIVSGIVKVFSSVLRGDFRGAWEGVKRIFSGALKTVGGYMRAATAPLRAAAAAAFGGIRGAVSKAWDTAKSVVSGALRSIGSTIRGAVAVLKSAAGTAAGGVISGFRGLAGRAVSIGSSVVSGLIRGLKSIPEKVTEAAKSLGRSILNAVKDFLGISSPSKEFMKVGGHIVSGLAKGLEAGNVKGMISKHFGGIASLAGKLAGKHPAISLVGMGLKGLGKLFGGGSGVKLDLAPKGGDVGLVGIGRMLQRAGYQVGEHPAFGGVQGAHVPGSKHYSGRAIDVNADGRPGGEAKWLDRLYQMLKKFPHSELLWRTKGHYDHLHFALQSGGQVPGSGSGDKVRALLEPGEGIINKKAVRAMGGRGAIDALNSMVPRFASGGVVARAAYAAGFRGNNLVRMVAEAKGESSWNERAVGDGGKSKGLWQIHTGFNPWASRLNLFDPAVNARAAMRIFRSQGVGAWYANHAPHMGAARRAVASMGNAPGRRRGRQPSRQQRRAAGLLVRGGRGTEIYSGNLKSGQYADFGAKTRRGGFTPQKGITKGIPFTPQRVTRGEATEGAAAAEAAEDPRVLAMQALAEATKAQAEESKALAAEIAKQNAFSASVSAVGLAQAHRALADMVAGQLGTMTAARMAGPSTGALARY